MFPFKVVNPFGESLIAKAISLNFFVTIAVRILRTLALYDLSSMLNGKGLCSRLNDTDSSVFKEFEIFLKNELKAKIKPISIPSDSEVSPDGYTVKEIV